MYSNEKLTVLKIIPAAKPVVYPSAKVPTCEEEEDSTNRPDAIAGDGEGGEGGRVKAHPSFA